MAINFNYEILSAGIGNVTPSDTATAIVNNKMYNIGMDCIDWCNVTSQVYSYNELMIGLMIPALAFIFFNMYHLILQYGHKNEYLQGVHAQHNTQLVLKTLYRLANWSFLIFFGWVVYQRFWGLLLP